MIDSKLPMHIFLSLLASYPSLQRQRPSLHVENSSEHSEFREQYLPRRASEEEPPPNREADVDAEEFSSSERIPEPP